MILPISLALARGSRPVRLTRSYALRSASLALWEVGVLPVVENQRCENSHVKAKKPPADHSRSATATSETTRRRRPETRRATPETRAPRRYGPVAWRG